MHSTDTDTDTDTDTSWTFAELAGTYRFWALLALLALVYLASTQMNTALFAYSDASLRTSQIGALLLQYGQWFGYILGLVFGLLAVHRADQRDLLAGLVICTALSVVGVCLYLGLPTLKGISQLSLQFLQKALHSAVLVAVIARVASACRTPSAIASVIALMLSGQQALLVGLMPRIFGDPTWPLIFSLLALALACALLWPIRHARFDAPPQTRARALQPRYRRPGYIVTCALLPGIAMLAMFALLPTIGNFRDSDSIMTLELARLVGLVGLIYCYYWLYRVHGEVQYLLPSRRICSPGIALLIALLIPLSWPILLLILGEEIRSGAARRAPRPADSPVTERIPPVLHPRPVRCHGAGAALAQRLPSHSYR